MGKKTWGVAAAAVVAIGTALGWAQFAGYFANGSASKQGTSTLRFASAADGTENPDPGGDGGDPGGPGGPGSGGSPATPATSPQHALIAQIIQGCANTTLTKLVLWSPSKGMEINLDLVKDIGDCVQKEAAKYPELKDFGDIVEAATIHIGCVGDIVGLKEAVGKLGAEKAARIAGKSFAKAVIAAASLVGSKDCLDVGARLGFYSENNIALVLVNTGANCVVTSVGYGFDFAFQVGELSKVTKDELIDKLRAAIDSKFTKRVVDVSKLVKLPESVDKMFEACRKARDAAKAAGAEVVKGIDFFATGGVIQAGPHRIVLLPAMERWWSTVKSLLGLEREPLRFSVNDVQLIRGSPRDWFVASSPSGVLITGPSGAILVTPENPRFTLDGYSGRINFAPGSFSAVIDLAGGARQTFPLGADGKIVRTVNPDGSITVASRIVANGIGWNVLSVARGDYAESVLIETDGNVVLKNQNGRLVEVRYGNGTIETPYYASNGALIGSRVVYPDGTIGYGEPNANGKLSINVVILPDGSAARLSALVDSNGTRTGSIAYNGRGETVILNTRNEVVATYQSTAFTSAGKFAGELRCDGPSCYTTNASGAPILYVDRDGRVYRIASFIDQNGVKRKIEDYDPKRGDVIAQVVPQADSAYSAANRAIDAPTAASIEASMRALFGLNMYQGGGELGGPVVLQQCPLGGCNNYTTATVTCAGQSVPVQQAASVCAQLIQQDVLSKLMNAKAFAVDMPSQIEAGKRYRVRVGIENTSGDKAPLWISPEFGIVAKDATWGVDRVPLPAGNSLAGGGKINFVFDIVAPSVPGTYSFQWKMAQGANPFGNFTPPIDVKVTAPENPDFAVVDAFNYGPIVKRGSFASIFGTQIAEEIAFGADPSAGECQELAGGRSVELLRTDGSAWVSACMAYVSPQQINVYIPDVPVGNYVLVLNDTVGVTMGRSPIFWIGN